MLWVRLDERVGKHACALDVDDLGAGFGDRAIEGGEIALGVYQGGEAGVEGISSAGCLCAAVSETITRE